MPIKQARFKEKSECLSKEATYQLLTQIKPRLSLSGHTHHGCTKKLPLGDGLEITIPSFNWRNKNNPTIGLVRSIIDKILSTTSPRTAPIECGKNYD